MNKLIGNWNFPTQIYFGAGRIKELAKTCQALNINKPLLVTDPGLANTNMLLDAVAANQTAGINTTVFSDIKGNPVEKNVVDGLQILRDQNCDGVILFGGGSAMDVGKAIAFMAGQKRSIWDFEDVGDNYLRAELAGILPIIAVPTTSGTGSEVGRSSVILDTKSQTKKVIFHPKFMPAVVISDPELTLGLPGFLTAATGMDALAHCLEAYCSPSFHPQADGIAVEGMRLIKHALPLAYQNGQDVNARAEMLVAASMGATAFQKGLGAIHAMSHPLGALYDLHHGLTNAVVMPYVLEFNRRAIEEKIIRLAAWLELQESSFDAFMRWLLDLRAQLGLAHSLAELGMKLEHLPELASMAAADPTAPSNPLPLTVDNLKPLFERAYHGQLETY